MAEKTPVEQLTYKQASQELELIIFGLIPCSGVVAVPPLRISGMQTTTTNVNTIAMISAERPMRYAPTDEMKPPTQAEMA